MLLPAILGTMTLAVAAGAADVVVTEAAAEVATEAVVVAGLAVVAGAVEVVRTVVEVVLVVAGLAVVEVVVGLTGATDVSWSAELCLYRFVFHPPPHFCALSPEQTEPHPVEASCLAVYTFASDFCVSLAVAKRQGLQTESPQ